MDTLREQVQADLDALQARAAKGEKVSEELVHVAVQMLNLDEADRNQVIAAVAWWFKAALELALVVALRRV